MYLPTADEVAAQIEEYFGQDLANLYLRKRVAEHKFSDVVCTTIYTVSWTDNNALIQAHVVVVSTEHYVETTPYLPGDSIRIGSAQMSTATQEG